MKLIVVVISLILSLPLYLDVAVAGPAFSGITANADSAETVVNNPAGMTRLKSPSVYGNPTIVYTRTKDEATVPSTGERRTDNDDSVLALPGLYYVYPVNDRWAVGIGPNAAMGLSASFDDNWVGRYMMQNYSLTFAGVSPSVAYRISDRFSVGLSIPVTYSRYTLEKAVFNGQGSPDGSFELTADGWGVGATVGILYEPTQQTRFGLTYRSKTSVTDKGKPDLSGLSAQRAQLFNQYGVFRHEISIETGTPQVVNGGVYHNFGNGWSGSLDVAWVDLSEWGLEEVTIGDREITTRPSHYNDVWAATLGVNYALTPSWTLRGGMFYVSNPQDEKYRTATSRLDQMWGLGMGFEYAYGKGRSLAFDVTYVQFGEGKFTAHNVPLVGDVRVKSTTNYGLIFGIGTKW